MSGIGMSEEQQPPKIEFPCEDYPVKIIGDAAHDFEEFVALVVEEHAPGFDRTVTSVRQSGGGKYTAVSVRITATGVDQLKALHESLKQSGRVHMVL